MRFSAIGNGCGFRNLSTNRYRLAEVGWRNEALVPHPGRPLEPRKAHVDLQKLLPFAAPLPPEHWVLLIV
jgi:hypothetical protein